MRKYRERSKLPDTGLSIFAVMTQLANEHGAINLSQGFPDFDCHPELIELVHRAMQAGHNQYAPMPGILPLREIIAEKTESLYGAKYDPEHEVSVTAGATEALYVAMTAMVHPGDEVIVIEPAYDAYVPVITLNGGVPVYVPLQHPEYRLDWRQVKAAVTEKTRLLVLNSPHNPTGTIFTEQDMQQLIEIVRGTDIVIVSDEVYEHIVFDGRRHDSLARYPELAERSFVISSFGKTYHTTGWKIGYCLAPRPLTAEFRKVLQFVTYAANTPIQYAYAEFLKKPEFYLELPQFYQTKRDAFLGYMQGSRFRPLPCRGTYFQSFGYSAISDEGEEAFAMRMTREYGVAAIPLAPFYHDKTDHRVLRFCFAKRDETLKQAAELLCKI